MCLNQERPGMPSGLSQLRSTCIMPWLRARASLGSIGFAASLRVTDSFRCLPAASKASICLVTAVKSRDAAEFRALALDTKSEWKLPLTPQVAHANTGSFDSVADSLRESATPLRMTDLFLLANSATNWRMLLA